MPGSQALEGIIVEYEVEAPLTMIEATQLYERVICAEASRINQFYFKAENNDEGLQILCYSKTPRYIITSTISQDDAALREKDALYQHGEFEGANVDRRLRWEREYALAGVRERAGHVPLHLLLTYRKPRWRHLGSDMQVRIEGDGERYHVQLWTSRKLPRRIADALTQILTRH